jgi:hypothetical protein
MNGFWCQAAPRLPCDSAKAVRVAPQVGQGRPVNCRNQHFGQGNPKANQENALVAVNKVTARKTISKSVSRGAKGRAQSSATAACFHLMRRPITVHSLIWQTLYFWDGTSVIEIEFVTRIHQSSK